MSGSSLLDERLIARLEKLALLPRAPASGKWGGERPGTRRAPSGDVTDYRSFSSGDDLRWVDWNAYQRLRSLFIRMGPVAAGLPLYLLLDGSRSMDWGDPNKLFCMKQIAAVLGYVALRHLDPVSVVLVSGEGVARSATWLQRNQVGHLLRLLEDLQGVGTAGGRDWLRAIPRAPLRPGVVVAVTDAFIAEAEFDSLALGLARERHRALILHLLAPGEIEAGSDGDFELEDLETGRTCRVSVGEAVRSRYAAGVAAWRAELAAICRRRAASYIPLSSGWSIEEILVQRLWRQGIVA